MAANNTTVANSDTTYDRLYDRLKEAADLSGITLYGLANEVGITQTGIYKRKGRTGYSWTTLNAFSTALGKRLNRKPRDVYAYLTDLEPIDLSTSPSRSARGRRSAPAQ